MDRNWGVFHDCIGWSSYVTDVTYGEVKPEDLCQVPTVTPTISNTGKAMRLTRLEATLLAAQLDAQLVAKVKAEYGSQENWQDWLGNFGYWYASEIVK